MAVDDFLSKYYQSFSNGNGNPPPLIQSTTATGGGGRSRLQINNQAPNIQSPSSVSGGALFQRVLGNSQNNASQAFNQQTAKDQAATTDAYNAQAAGMQRDLDSNGVLKIPQQKTDNYKAGLDQLSTIKGMGTNALMGAQAQQVQRNAAEKYAQMQKQQQMAGQNYQYNVSGSGNNNAPYDPQYLAPGASPNNVGAQALAIAMTAYKNGTPYVWGGNSLTGGVDCSGLVQQAYARLGLKLPRTTYEQAKAGQVIRGTQNALPGDLVFYDTGGNDPNGIGSLSHVGIYMGNGQILEAKGTRYGIRISGIGNYATIVRPWS